MSDELVGKQFVVGEPVPAGRETAIVNDSVPEKIEFSYVAMLDLIEKHYPDDESMVGYAVSYTLCPVANVLRCVYPHLMGVVHSGAIFKVTAADRTHASFGSELHELVMAIDREFNNGKDGLVVSAGRLKLMLKRRIGG